MTDWTNYNIAVDYSCVRREEEERRTGEARRIICLPRLPYSHDLSSCEYRAFRNLGAYAKGKKLYNCQEVKSKLRSQKLTNERHLVPLISMILKK